jgi:hypothetical protein
MFKTYDLHHNHPLPNRSDNTAPPPIPSHLPPPPDPNISNISNFSNFSNFNIATPLSAPLKPNYPNSDDHNLVDQLQKN